MKQKGARPEDFMDDEDLQDLKDSRNLVDTADEMDLTGGTKSDLAHRGVEDLEQECVKLINAYPPLDTDVVL